MSPIKSFRQSWTRIGDTKALKLVLAFIGTLLLVLAVSYWSGGSLLQAIADLAFVVGDRYQQWFAQQDFSNPLLLWLLSFSGGLVASISPCILSLLPVNLSYIGTQQIQSRREALFKATAFVLGVVTILSLLGLFSSFAGIVLVKFRGYFHIGVGFIILGMGLNIAGLLPLSLPRWRSPNSSSESPPLGRQLRLLLTSPYGVGITFALVSSPCTSPIMVAVLTAAAATGSQLQSFLAMISYAIGYTAIIFLASLFTGLVKQTRLLLGHAQIVIRLAGLVLVLVGGFYLLNGLQWLGATLN